MSDNRQETSASPPSADPLASPASTAAPVPAATPRDEDPPGSGWWQVIPDATPMTFEVPACVPVKPARGTRFAHPCAVKTYGPDGWLASVQTLDTEGRELGLARFQQGVRTTSYRSTYDAQGHKIRDDYFNGDKTTPDGFTEWVYDAADRLVLMINDGGVQTRYFYDAQGQLSLSEHFSAAGSDPSWERFSYNARGQVLSHGHYEYDYCTQGLDNPGLPCLTLTRDTFTYGPSGLLVQETYDDEQELWSPHWRTDYDEQGRPIAYTSWAGEGGSDKHWTYDARGLLEQEHFAAMGASSSWHHWTDWRYDAAGQLGVERLFAGDSTPPGDHPTSGSQLKLTRSFHACGSEDLLFQEEDLDADGARNGWRELMRDAAGNLRVDRYHGSLSSSSGLTRIEYDYGCHE